ncbi:trichohyalin [Carassius gibelio]|uniref:trichohyalin n=1 Tax=Carassius gibelio TaxID=101364 RepID=UPI00227774EA|nr:trichohyalin [Carassius gibelio]
MSLSALPEWKQLLLERKRREEEEKERREKEEEERLACMPAWKRGIIQRRRAKQDEEREREKERDTLDILSINEDIVTEQMDSKPTHHLQTEQTGYKLQKQISKDTISPIQQNPFIRSENSFRRDNRGKEVLKDGETEDKNPANNRGRERNRETEKEIWRGRDREMWVEKMGSKIEGRERDRSTGREIREADTDTSLLSPVIGLHTIQAHNIIIIEKDKNVLDLREKEVREDQKRMRMDLREFLAGGGSVTEIRASEVLIIKPPMMDGVRETETAGIPERGSERLEKEMQLVSRTDNQRAKRVLNHKDIRAPECSGRVSQLLSKFGEHPKPPIRSKSTECFKNRARYSTGDLFVEEEQSTEETEMSLMLRGVPKRSFSFSDRVVRQQDDRDCKQKTDFKLVERSYSERRVKTGVADQSGSEPKVARRWGRLKHDEVMHEKRQNKRNKSVCGETEERNSSLDRREDFTLASVKNPEGGAFARRVPIKQDGTESSSERVREENEREIMIDKEIHRDKRQEERETLLQKRSTDYKIEPKTESEKRLNQEKETDAVSKQSLGIYISPSNNSTLDFPTDSQRLCDISHSADSSCQTMSDYDGQWQPSGQVVLTQHTEDLLSKIGRVQLDGELKSAGYMFSQGDNESISGGMSNQDQTEHQHYQSLPKQASEELHFTSQLPQQTVILGQSKLCTQKGVTIPRTVFYGVDVSSERRRVSRTAGDKLDRGEVERRESWKVGRPLTQEESLKERICQQEKERQKNREDGKDEGSREAGGTVREQEETTVQTLRLFDVTQEVDMAKSNPQLPVPVSLSLLQSASTERVAGEIAGDASESDICPREAERDAQRHVEECGTCIAWRTPDVDERERKEELLEKEYLPPSFSPSPTLSDSLDAMSRIYNLKSVGSRTAVCISERTADMPPHSGPQGKYNPIRQAPSPDILPVTAKMWNQGRDGDKTQGMESAGVQMVQRQVGRLQLREQEAGCGNPTDKMAQPSMETYPLVEPEIRATEGQKKPDILRETQKAQMPPNPRFSQAQLNAQSQPPKQVRSFTINSRSTESTENSQKPPEQSSPSQTSPCTASPSSSPSPPLFSIRSASGRPGKRGTTITITPRKPAGAASSGGIPTGTPAVPKADPQGHISTPAPSSTKEAGKKRYPTAEEIEVIGGYQNLERSCLVKSKGTPKAVKVCFDDAQLERVCEYPSEGCAVASLPSSPHPGPEDGGMEEGRRGGEQENEGQEEDEEEEESAAFVSRRGINECAAKARFIKVDESCKRLSK